MKSGFAGNGAENSVRAIDASDGSSVNTPPQRSLPSFTAVHVTGIVNEGRDKRTPFGFSVAQERDPPMSCVKETVMRPSFQSHAACTVGKPTEKR